MKKYNNDFEEKDDNEDYITITINDAEKNEDLEESETESDGKKSRRASRKKRKKDKKTKKKWSRKKKVIVVLSIFLGIIMLIGIAFGVYLVKAKGNVKEAVLNMATDIVGTQDPIFVLVLGISEDINVELTDTIMLCAYNPSTQKAFMLSVPRDTFVGKNEATANGYDKINALYQKSAEKTVEAVELLTGVDIDYYVIVRNISISSIFECIGSVDFDVPINMDYDDRTQDLHIHLKKGYQTLEPDQIEQLLRFRHNNDGTSYPSSYGDNDYGRMRTQREFLKAAMDQAISIQNIGKLKDVAAMVYTNLQTNMSGYKVLEYVPHGLKFSTSNLRSEQLPGQSDKINNLWFYKSSKSKTRALMDELMIYLELDNETLDSHYKYASAIKGVKPDQNWVSNTVGIDDDTTSSSSKKDTNTVSTNSNTIDTNAKTQKCDHDYAVYDDSRKATCTNAGTIVYKCLKCSHEYSKQTAKIDHNYVNGTCTMCGGHDSNYQPPKEEHKHSYTNQVTQEATCTSEGIRTYTCSSCKQNYTEKIAKKAHNYVNGTCSACGTKDSNYEPPKEHTHNYTSEITKPATCTENGIITEKCSCGDTKTKQIPKIDHNYVNGTCTMCGGHDSNYQPPEEPVKPTEPTNPDNPLGGEI